MQYNCRPNVQSGKLQYVDLMLLFRHHFGLEIRCNMTVDLMFNIVNLVCRPNVAFQTSLRFGNQIQYNCQPNVQYGKLQYVDLILLFRHHFGLEIRCNITVDLMFNTVLSLVDLMLPFRQNHLVLGLEIRRNAVDLMFNMVGFNMPQVGGFRGCEIPE